MSAVDTWTLSARDLLTRYRDRSLSPVEVVDAALDRIGALDSGLGALTALCAERARAEAAACEQAYLEGRAQGALAGVPFVVKDLIDTEGVETAYGSPLFAGHVPDRDADVVRNVREAGGILIGKSQTHEFAWGITSVNEHVGTSRNPWNRELISGGSSGGSAVALAARYVPLAIGSDTGGSIRAPSAFCGTVGFKPTFGRLSTERIRPLAPSLDHPGPMARTPADAALLLAAMEGKFPRPRDAAAAAGLRGRTVGLCPDLHVVTPGPAQQAAYDAAVRTIEALEARMLEVALPDAETIWPTFGAIQRAEALRSHRRAGLYPQRKEAYGADVRVRLESAEAVTLDDYVEATAARERVRARFDALFARVDLLLTPVSAVGPPPIGVEHVEHDGRERELRECIMSYTVPQDLLGLPACAVRAGFDDGGVPVGVQLTGPRGADNQVLAAAEAFVAATPELQDRWPEAVVVG